MHPADAKAHIHWLTQTDDEAFTDAEILRLMKLKMESLALEVVGVNEDFFGMPMTADLEANKREYFFETEILSQIKMVEAKFNGTDWIRLEEFDQNRYKRAASEAVITSLFTNNEGNAAYDIFRGALWLYSGTVPAVTGGLKLWTFTYPSPPTDLTSTVDMSIPPSNIEHGFPRPLHEVLCLEVSKAWKESKTEPIPLSQEELSLEFKKRKILASMSPINLDRRNEAQYPGSETQGNDGYDY